MVQQTILNWRKTNMITITENAQSKITDLLSEENNADLKLRTFVQGGGNRIGFLRLFFLLCQTDWVGDYQQKIFLKGS